MTEYEQALFHHDPRQHNAHVDTWTAWVWERTQYWNDRMSGKGPRPNFDPEAVEAVLAALRGD